MPPKPSLQLRTWGTRFDTLPTSPPVSPPAHEQISAQPTTTNTDTAPLKKKEDKMPHDASVFVGSLPVTVDQTELTRLLSEHLSEHTEVKNIKVVRDSKGGVCAFVQCEDAASAASLINTLHSSPPKYFLGRILRYEPARAFRTLLISYRLPMQVIPAHDVDGRSTTDNKLTQRVQTIELDLPYAMRVWKPKSSKFFSLLYNAEAVDAEAHSKNQPSPHENSSLFLQPVAFDVETIRALASYFGRLEHCRPYQVDVVGDEELKADTDENWRLYPAPHDAPRSAGMDTTCWEIKWDHRDDCVMALMTLRRVPHLTVTWAHQPPPLGFDQRSPHPGNQFHAHSTIYPLHVQDHLQPGLPPTTPLNDIFRNSDSSGNSVTGRTVQAECASDRASDRTSVVHSHKATQPPSSYQGSPRSLKNLNLFDVKDDLATTSRLEWSEMDFPPLGDMRGERRSEYGVWGEKKPHKGGDDRSPALSLPQLPILESEHPSILGEVTEENQGSNEGQEIDMPPTPGLGKSPITPKTPGSQYPVTPTSANSDIQRMSFKEFEGQERGYYNEFNQPERELDPTTLFVGGLETFGPGAWDEDKVTKFFSRFGGLESVKVVRPLNSHAAFAFVKFDNTESPARAVLEEHNRIYEGRAMRVQLRDCNPPRGSWRHSRGRGRFHHTNFGGSQRRLPDESPEKSAIQSGHHRRHSASSASGFVAPFTVMNDDSSREAAISPELSTYSGANALTRVEHESGNDLKAHDLAANTPEPSVTTLDTPSQPSHYREWYDDPIPTVITPPPSSFGSSNSVPASASALPYPMGGGYYAPPPWMHPYAHQIQYPMPYFGYSGYPVPGQQVPVPVPSTFTSPPGSDASGPVPIQNQWPSMGVYGSYIPYAAQPARTPSLDQSQSQHLNSRAPLVPTGFIQNEQGTLIAVYQPEALDQYMAGNHPATPSASQAPGQSLPSWPQYPHPSAYPFPPATVVLPSRHALPTTAHAGWNPGQGYNPHAPVPQIPGQQNPGMGYRGGYGDGGRQPGTPSFRRQPGRRDQGNNHNHRSNQSRTFNGRGSRGNMNNVGFPPSGQAHLRLSQYNQGEWNQ